MTDNDGSPAQTTKTTEGLPISRGPGHLADGPAVVLIVGGGNLPLSQSIVHRWVRQGITDKSVDELIEALEKRLAAEPSSSPRALAGVGEWQVWFQPVEPLSKEFPGEAVVVAREDTGPWAEEDTAPIRVFADMWGTGWRQVSGYSNLTYQRNLDSLMVTVATRLAAASADSLQQTLEWTVMTLAEFLGADAAFLRRNDNDAQTSVLVAEYPKRTNVADPDPLGVVPFDSDPLFAALRDLKEPIVSKSTQMPPAYSERVAEASGAPEVSGAAVPLLLDGETKGCLGFAHFGEREWLPSELNALLAVASLVLQLTMRVAAENQLRYSAFHDDMTGMFNRRALLDEIDRRMDRGTHGTALLFLDLDRFKVMNDCLGHAAGDRVLATVAERVRSTLRPSDFAARLGGDEFVVLIDDPGGDLDAVAAARRILDLVKIPIEVGNQNQEVSHTASIGIAFASPGRLGALDLIRRADIALYAAKALGSNEVVVFNEVMEAEADRRSNMELRLRSAIADEGFRLFYQPEFNLDTGRLLAVEALVRWEHPTQGLLAAEKFITIAEEAGLIIGIGSWVLEEACRQLARWRQAYPQLDLVVRVNMSPAELALNGVLEHVERCLRIAGVPPSSLCLEVTEHAIVTDLDRLVSVLEDLRSLGVHLAIDDFGTGHSSMVQLKQLPIHILKVDQTFVDGIGDNPIDQAIVASIIGLGNAIGLEVVAEGVETLRDMKTLSSLGCCRAQGFLLGRPAAAAALEPLLERGGIDLALLTDGSSDDHPYAESKAP